MKWKQLGMVYAPSGTLDWTRSHAQAPSAILLNDKIRIYYGTRNSENRSLTSFIEVDANDPLKILYIHDKPVIDFGKPGTHDEDGVIPSHIMKINNEFFMYYGGVSRGGSVPYKMSIGLAISNDGGLSFKRKFEGPVIDRTPLEPYMTMAPCILVKDEQWRVWYGTGVQWVEIDGKFEPIYLIKTATSEDGLSWSRSNEICIEPLSKYEANTRPSVRFTENGYEMWFSYRNSVNYRDGEGSYRIGHALSLDGINWERKHDPVELMPSKVGWNSHTMSYPNIIEYGKKIIMFHNGNGFGLTGFGCSILEYK
jgi:hypothetical protein